MTIGEKIKNERLLKSLSQQNLAALLNMSADTVSLWENNKSIPAVEMIIALCKIFDISADYLLGLSDFK